MIGMAGSSPAMTTERIFKQQASFSRRDSPEVCSQSRASELRGRGESRMPAASDGLVCELVEKHTSFSHHRKCRTSGFPCTTNSTAYA